MEENSTCEGGSSAHDGSEPPDAAREGNVSSTLFLPASPVSSATQIFAVANQKGGVGKTTTVINLAACLVQRGRKVLVIDLDPQANATSGLGLSKEGNGSIYPVLLGEGSILDLIRESALEGLHIIPAELDLAGAEVDMARREGYLHCLRQSMEPLTTDNRYQFILLDCPPSLGILTMNALAAAQAMIVPIQCEYYALEGLSVISRLVEQIKSGGANPYLEIEGILMTMYDARTKLSSDVVIEVRNYFGSLVYETVIPRNVRLSEAPSFGKPIIQYDPHCTGAVAYERFADEFLRRVEARCLHRAPGQVPASPPARLEPNSSPIGP